MSETKKDKRENQNQIKRNREIRLNFKLRNRTCQPCPLLSHSYLKTQALVREHFLERFFVPNAPLTALALSAQRTMADCVETNAVNAKQ